MSSLKTAIKRFCPPWLWERLHLARQAAFMRRYRRSVASYRPRVVRHTFAGLPLSIRLADRTDELMYDQDWQGLPELPILRRHGLRPGARAFDIGAHKGVVAMLLAEAVGPEGSVLAVEPNLHNCRAAEENCLLNGYRNVEVLRGAVGDRAGTIVMTEMPIAKVDTTGLWGKVEVPCYTVDDLAAEHGRPDVLYIDVEGFETQVLRGARATLESRPDCYVEVHVGVGLEHMGNTVESVLECFPSGAFDLLVAPGAMYHEETEFAPFEPGSEVLKARFFLLALGRR
jgi:FkbM family methyltransferase